MRKIAGSSLLSEVKKGKTLAVWGAAWCQPCAALKATIEQIESEGSPVNFVYLDVVENHALVNDLHIQSVPTSFLYEGGKISKQIMGAPSKKDLLKKLQ